MNKTRRRKQRERRKWERAYSVELDCIVRRLRWVGGNGRVYVLERWTPALGRK